MSTVLTLGTFDLFHAGHVNLLRACDQEAGPSGRVVVGLNTDGFVLRYKHHLPVIDYRDREAVLIACRYVSAVVPNDQPDGTIRDVLDAVRPDVIVVGSDWQGRDYLAQLGIGPDDLRAYSTRIAYRPYTSGISSTAIKERLA